MKQKRSTSDYLAFICSVGVALVFIIFGSAIFLLRTLLGNIIGAVSIAVGLVLLVLANILLNQDEK